MNKNHEILFTPMQVGAVTVKNRFVHAPMEGTTPVEWMSGYKFNENSREYLLERARSGVGLIIPGITCVKSMMGNKWLYQNEKMFMGPVKDLMDEIHQYGTKFFLQIGAGFGRVLVMQEMLKKMMTGKVMGKLTGTNKLLTAASDDIPNVWDPNVRHRAMTEQEIQDIIDGYVKSAVLCQKAGIDGIEIHAVHEGYLLDQFTIANTNKRTDQYGGSLENRCRFVTQIIRGIKEACGKDYPVVVRYSVTSKMRGFNQGALPGEEYEEFGRDREESIACARILEEAGADALDADNGSYDSWFWAHPPMYMPLACNLDDAAFIKQYVKIPVFCAGRMEDPDISSEAIASGKIDGVTIGRQLLADGEYCKKVEEGRLADIRPCIACHNGCFAISKEPNGITGTNPVGNGHCAINPQTLEENKKAITPASVKKKVAIVGGGIGGMEAARVAALRGHEVTIYEKSGELGGVFIAAAAPDFKEKDKMLIQWYIRQMETLKVKICLHTDMTPQMLSDLDAEEVIVATGASPRRLKVEGADSEKVMNAVEYLRGYKECGERVVIIGGGLTGCEIAYDAVRKGKKPVIVEMLDDILNVPHLCAANSNMLREIIRCYKIPVYTGVKTTAITEDGVVIEGKDGRRTIPADSVVTSIGYIPENKLAEAGKSVHVIGDASKVGNLMNAVWQANETARAI
ncbi:MAG: FAD-dependent oxidoreductase [Eubacteriales bacterium]|nr:FAD-dependent oxidoreductase [Eubacteriales bacterium]